MDQRELISYMYICLYVYIFISQYIHIYINICQYIISASSPYPLLSSSYSYPHPKATAAIKKHLEDNKLGHLYKFDLTYDFPMRTHKYMVQVSLAISYKL